MSYFGSHYRLYVPPHITGTEKVRITITSPKTMEEMEQRIKMRYAFAMSSFGRMFTPIKITDDMRSICKKWSEDVTELPPTEDLYQVDRYFLELWKKRNELEETN
jgi:hypothetical protein|tara:strand:- start:184 stop:498 length:315 start_codon:yes stop_codon:yes gene_type:complete